MHVPEPNCQRSSAVLSGHDHLITYKMAHFGHHDRHLGPVDAFSLSTYVQMHSTLLAGYKKVPIPTRKDFESIWQIFEAMVKD